MKKIVKIENCEFEIKKLSFEALCKAEQSLHERKPLEAIKTIIEDAVISPSPELVLKMDPKIVSPLVNEIINYTMRGSINPSRREDKWT